MGLVERYLARLGLSLGAIRYPLLRRGGHADAAAANTVGDAGRPGAAEWPREFGMGEKLSGPAGISSFVHNRDAPISPHLLYASVSDY